MSILSRVTGIAGTAKYLPQPNRVFHTRTLAAICTTFSKPAQPPTTQHVVCYSLGRKKITVPDDSETGVDLPRERAEAIAAASVRQNVRNRPYNPVDLATSIDYLNSDVYRTTYRDKPVWYFYRRNFKGHYPPQRTRPNCVVAGKLITSNPCPICRDDYLLIDYRNTELLKQFVNPISATVLEPSTTGLCQYQHANLLLEVEKAQDIGTIEMWLPFLLYNYRDYFPADVVDQLDRLNSQQLADQTRNPLRESFAALPPDMQQMLLQTNGFLPHATELAAVKQPTRGTEIDRPRVPNRYQLEETYKALLLRRRRAKHMLLT